MNFHISKHAHQEIIKRNLNLTEIENVLNSPAQIVYEHDGIVCYQSLITQQNKNYLLRVMVNNTAMPKVVVTAYKTSKINKYWKI